MDISTDQQVKSRNQRKPLANPFGNPIQTTSLDDEFEHLNSSTNTQTTATGSRGTNVLKTPFPQMSAGPSGEDELEGSISLGGEESRYTRASSEPKGQDQYSISFGGAPGGNGGSQEPLMKSNNPIMNSILGFASSFINEQGNNQQVEYDEENEPPLLEDLGIDPKLIKMRALSVLRFQECREEFVKEADMTGPLALFLVFGTLLLLSGKIHFGYLYGFGTIGTISIYLMLNLLSQVSRVQLYNTMSILGYCLFPIVVLAFFNVFLNLANFFGFVLSAIAIGWATLAATNFFQVLLNLTEQKWLIAYPILLFYLIFVIITIF